MLLSWVLESSSVLFYFILFFCLRWVFIAACGLSLFAASWGYSSHRGGFSCCGAWALGAWASVVAAHGLSSWGTRALERRLSSCGTQAQLLRSMWGLPGPGIRPVSPVLAGGLLTTVPPGTSEQFSPNKPAECLGMDCSTSTGCPAKIVRSGFLGHSTLPVLCR